jgi:hypothetical protein
MGTRSLTRIKDTDDAEIACIYRQMDGYPTGMGADLKEFLEPFTIINGITSSTDPKPAANTMCCLAAQIVAHFKTEIGNIYLYPTGSKGCGEEYVYTIFQDGDKVGIKVYSVYGKRTLFEGPISDFDPAKAEALDQEN